MEIVHIYREVLVERNLIFQLEDVQLQIAAAEIFCFEAKIVAGNGLHAQYGLVEFHQLREFLVPIDRWLKPVTFITRLP